MNVQLSAIETRQVSIVNTYKVYKNVGLNIFYSCSRVPKPTKHNDITRHVNEMDLTVSVSL